MNRRLVAALACRVQGTRLYGKPLQNLAPGLTILDHIVTCAATCDEIDDIVLGVSEGAANLPFVELAGRRAIGHIIGDPKDVMGRLIQCGHAEQATDIFRITTECPFTIWEMLPNLWSRHVANDNEITVIDHLPDGVHFEIYQLDALERCHRDGTDADRSEYVSNYPRQNQSRFRIEIARPDPSLARTDLRLTVDYPEDLVLCRSVYGALEHLGPRIPIAPIIEFLDRNPDLVELVSPYAVAEPVWDGVAQREVPVADGDTAIRGGEHRA